MYSLNKLVLSIGIIFLYTKSNNLKETAATEINNGQVISDNSYGDFIGEKGKTLEAIDANVYIAESEVNDGNLHSFNYYSEKFGKTIYFFIVKASDETYRAAAHACEVCFGSKLGFKQIGDQIRCENCRTIYTKDQIALQKGGCNPRPINPDVEVVDGKLVINLSDIEKTADLF